jgi:hypothetical protein
MPFSIQKRLKKNNDASEKEHEPSQRQQVRKDHSNYCITKWYSAFVYLDAAKS